MAERKAREMERVARQASEQQPIAIKTAIQAFLADQSARKLLAQSINKSRFLLETEFGTWCDSRALASLEDIGPAEMREFRHTWENASKSAHRKHERMRSFLCFASATAGCKGIRWML